MTDVTAQPGELGEVSIPVDLPRCPDDLIMFAHMAKLLDGVVPKMVVYAAVRRGDIKHWRFAPADRSALWVSQREVWDWVRSYGEPRRGTGPYSGMPTEKSE